MKKMVGDILYLNRCGEDLDIQKVEPRIVLENHIVVHRIAIAESRMQVHIEERERVQIVLDADKMWIRNDGIRIDVDILPHIFEHFVSGNHDNKENRSNSHGLELYIASYYANKIGMKIEIDNDSLLLYAVFIRNSYRAGIMKLSHTAVSEISDMAMIKIVSTSIFLGVGALIPMATILMGYLGRRRTWKKESRNACSCLASEAM